MRLKLNRAAALTLTGTAILATLSQVGGAADRSYIEGQDHENSNEEQVKADDLKAESSDIKFYHDVNSDSDYNSAHEYKTNSDIDFGNLRSYFTYPAIMPMQLIASLNGKDIKKGNQILLGSITSKSSDDAFRTTLGDGKQGSNQVYDQNNNLIGNSYYKLDDNDSTIHSYLNVTTDKKYDGSVNITLHSSLFYYTFLKNGNFPAHSSVVTATLTTDTGNIYKFIQHMPQFTTWRYYNRTQHFNPNQIAPWGSTGFFVTNPSFLNGSSTYISGLNDVTQPPQAQNYHRVMEVSGINFPTKFEDINIRSLEKRFYMVDENGNLNTEEILYFGQAPEKLQLTDNLTAKQLYDQTPVNKVGFSHQSKQNPNDWLVCWNISPSLFQLTKDKMEENIKSSSFLYLFDSKDPQRVLTNTINFWINKNDGMPYGTIFNVEPKSNVGDGLYNFKDIDVLNNKVSPTYTVHRFTGKNTGAGQYLNNTIYQFVDDANNGTNVGSPVAKSGKAGDNGSLSLTIPTGYKLAKGQTLPTTYNILDHDQVIDIHLVHSTQKKNNSSGVGTRRITYIGAPKNPDPVTQTVHFSRIDTVDDATDKVISSSDWQPTDHNGQWDAVNTPMIAGYKPDKAIVPADKASVGTTEVEVTYSKADQHAKLTVHDDTANTDLNDYTENSTGLYQDQINFKTAPSAVEQELKDKGYNIVSDSFKDSPTYNADDSKNNFVIHVTHKIVPITADQPKTPNDFIPDTKQHYPTGVNTNDLNKDVQRSIFYKYEDNSQAEPTVVQKAHFSRTVKVDAVTQKIVDNGTWTTKDNYPEVATKSIDGYTPDKTKVDSATPSMTTNQDQTVVYHANDEDAAITYIDDTTGKVLKTDTQKAKYKQTIKFATDPNTQIQTYKDQGYVLVSSDWKDGSTYQTDPTKNKFTVHLKHGTSTVTPDEPKKPTDIIPGTKQHYPTGVDTNDLNQSQQRQITYTYADSKKQASPTVTQKATFHRTATVDNVTGKTAYTDWTTSDQYPEVKSPAIEGYTPDKSNVPVTKPVLNTKQDVAVIYNPNPEQVDVIAQDNTGKQLSKSTLHGNYNTDYTATTPVIKGYHLIKMPDNTHGTYKTHNDPIIYIYAPDSNTVPEQTDGTPKPDKSSYPNDLTPAKRSNKLPETGTTNFASELNSALTKVIHNLL